MITVNQSYGAFKPILFRFTLYEIRCQGTVQVSRLDETADVDWLIRLRLWVGAGRIIGAAPHVH